MDRNKSRKIINKMLKKVYNKSKKQLVNGEDVNINVDAFLPYIKDLVEIIGDKKENRNLRNTAMSVILMIITSHKYQRYIYPYFNDIVRVLLDKGEDYHLRNMAIYTLTPLITNSTTRPNIARFLDDLISIAADEKESTNLREQTLILIYLIISYGDVVISADNYYRLLKIERSTTDSGIKERVLALIEKINSRNHKH